MKHPASTAAFLLIGLAFLVGGATWLLSAGDLDTGQAAQVPALAPSNEIGFVAVTPKEQFKATNLERTQRELKRIREVGEEISPTEYMIPDANGDPTYYSTELVKGRGRNGEPIYATMVTKKIHNLPAVDPKKYLAPEAPKLKKQPVKGLLKIGKPAKGEGAEGSGTGDGDPDSGQSDGGGDKGGGNATLKKDG
jgi:uncharacterized membrane protein YgcG